MTDQATSWIGVGVLLDTGNYTESLAYGQIVFSNRPATACCQKIKLTHYPLSPLNACGSRPGPQAPLKKICYISPENGPVAAFRLAQRAFLLGKIGGAARI